MIISDNLPWLENQTYINMSICWFKTCQISSVSITYFKMDILDVQVWNLSNIVLSCNFQRWIRIEFKVLILLSTSVSQCKFYFTTWITRPFLMAFLFFLLKCLFWLFTRILNESRRWVVCLPGQWSSRGTVLFSFPRKESHHCSKDVLNQGTALSPLTSVIQHVTFRRNDGQRETCRCRRRCLSTVSTSKH